MALVYFVKLFCLESNSENQSFLKTKKGKKKESIPKCSAIYCFMLIKLKLLLQNLYLILD